MSDKKATFRELLDSYTVGCVRYYKGISTDPKPVNAAEKALIDYVEKLESREKELRSQRDIGIGIICRAFQPMKFQVRALLAALWEIKNSQGSSVKRIATMAILRNSATAEAKVLEGLGWKRIKARDDRPHDHFYDPLSNRKISASEVYSAFALLLPNSELEREKT